MNLVEELSLEELLLEELPSLKLLKELNSFWRNSHLLAYWRNSTPIRETYISPHTNYEAIILRISHTNSLESGVMH
jgi:hypothetical protein